ncbi:MAG: hypothetical protein ACREB9_09305, partial [Thermoplasmata archaeon]
MSYDDAFPAPFKALRENDLLMMNFGPSAWVPFQVKRRVPYLPNLVYDPVLNGAIAGVLAPAGASPGSGQVASFQQNLLFGLSQSVTGIAGVPDLFKTQFDYEILQCAVGVAPAWCRMWLQQPGGAGSFETNLDNNVFASSTYPDVGWFHGYPDGSPFKTPTERSEFFVLNNYSVSFALYNPHTIPINPRMNFLINRLFVTPVTDPRMLARMFQRSVPVKTVSIGVPDTPQTFNGKSYGNIQPISESLVYQALSSNTSVAANAAKAL